MAGSPASSIRGGFPLGLAGATAATRYVGATASGAPASGTFVVGDFVIDQSGAVYVCTVAGSPGTWIAVGASALADGWTAAGETWTRTAATTFTVPTDLTAKYTVGTRLKLTQTTAKYFVVVGSSFAAGDTTVTVTGGTDYTLAAAAITSPFYSYQENPQGYPGWFNHTPASTGFSSTTSDIAKFSANGRVCTVELFVSGTSNATTFTSALPITCANSLAGGGAFYVVRVTDAGTVVAGGVDITTLTATFRKLISAAGGFTATGTKGCYCVLVYEI